MTLRYSHWQNTSDHVAVVETDRLARKVWTWHRDERGRVGLVYFADGWATKTGRMEVNASWDVLTDPASERPTSIPAKVLAVVDEVWPGGRVSRPIAVRIVVDLDSPLLASTLSTEQQAKLAAGIVCTRTEHGVSISWGKQGARRESASVFADVDSAIAWLLERAAGFKLCAELCPNTETARYSVDRAAFLVSAATLLRSQVGRLWGLVK